MALEIKVTSHRIGGNPGGKCVVRDAKTESLGYFKFCYGSRIEGYSPFVAANQPVYEAITFELARRLGLKTPSTFVLLNDQKDVRFTNWKEFANTQQAHDPSGRRFYFVSKLIPHPIVPDVETKSRSLLEMQKPYLESLLISDIINIKQNFAFYNNGAVGEVKYIDLGCSFVHAKEGFLQQPNRLRIMDFNAVRPMSKNLRRHTIISADNDFFINTEEFVISIHDMCVPTLNPLGSMRTKDLISVEEIKHIVYYVMQGFTDSLKSYEQKGLLLKSA